MGEAEYLELVSQGYAALDRDDVPSFLELCAADAEWHYPAHEDLAYGGVWRGHDGILAFFDAHDEAEEIVGLDVDDLFAHGHQVFALGIFRGRALPSGRAWETRFVHVITVQDGLWIRFEAYFDTAAAVAAHRA